MSAAYVGHSRPHLQFLLDVAQGRNPRADKIGGIPRTKEFFATMEDAVNMFMPAHAIAGAERFRDPWNRRKRYRIGKCNPLTIKLQVR